MRWSRIAVVGFVVVGLAACGDDPSDLPQPTTAGTAPETGAAGTGPEASTSTSAATTTSTSAPPTTAATTAGALDGNTYVSTKVEGFTLVPGTQVAITFDGQNISATAGCNTLASTWSVQGNVLMVPQMASTMMACNPPALMDQDTWLSAVLTSQPTIAVAGDTLTITAQGATLTMTDQEVAIPSQSIEGTTWTVEALNTANSSSTVPAGVRPPTLTFQGGTVAVDTGCNTGSGSYTLGNGTVTFGPIALTRKACIDPANQVEQQVVAVLDGTATVAIQGGTLTLTNGSNGLVLGASSSATTTTTAVPGATSGAATTTSTTTG
jgi:heat shock protein HslJ